MALEDLHLLPPDQQEEILNRAALDPPEGVDSIFENPPNENDLLLAVVSIGLVIASAAFLLRAYARAGVMRQVSVEDGVWYNELESHPMSMLTMALNCRSSSLHWICMHALSDTRTTVAVRD